ncbi:MAG: GxxExxY protein [Bacteroidota bacterium]|nr:GxxExxY protein [Bacteroidota bacterium]MDP4236465.1 GxxExxY protein [Bacteroidota bacterium]
MDEKILPDYEITRNVIGCAMAVHSELRSGFQEVIYQRAMEIELNKLGIEFHREYEMPIHYNKQVIGTRRVDFLVAGRISVELKAVATLEDIHLAQALNYLEAYNVPTGLLINFGAKSLQFHRLFNKKYRPN